MAGRVAVRASTVFGVVDLFDVAVQTAPGPPVEAYPLPPSTYTDPVAHLPSGPPAVGEEDPLTGLTSPGYNMRAPYRPSLYAFADELAEALAADANPNVALPLPQGWRFSMIGAPNKKIALSLDTPSAKRFRIVFG